MVNPPDAKASYSNVRPRCIPQTQAALHYLLVTHRKGAGVGHRCREDVWFVISHLRYIHPTFPQCFRTSSREVKLGWPTVNSLSGKEIGRRVRPALPNTRGSDCMGRGHVNALVSEGIESRASIRASLPGWGKEFIDLAIQIDNLIRSRCSTRATPRYMPENTTAAEPMQLEFTHLTRWVIYARQDNYHDCSDRFWGSW